MAAVTGSATVTREATTLAGVMDTNPLTGAVTLDDFTLAGTMKHQADMGTIGGEMSVGALSSMSPGVDNEPMTGG